MIKSLSPTNDLLKIDERAAIKLVTELMAIPGRSGQERAIITAIRTRLKQIGIPASAVAEDTAHKRSPLRGEAGNLIVKLPGTIRKPRRLLAAHVDTVPLCVGSQPVRRGERIVSRDPNTALGADDRAGASVLLHTLTEIRRRRLPHPPLTFLWPVQEEVGLLGRGISIGKNWAGRNSASIGTVALPTRRRSARRAASSCGSRSMASPATPVHIRNRESARSASRAWLLPSWCATAGTGKSSKGLRRGPATSALFKAAKRPMSSLPASLCGPRRGVTIRNSGNRSSTPFAPHLNGRSRPSKTTPGRLASCGSTHNSNTNHSGCRRTIRPWRPRYGRFRGAGLKPSTRLTNGGLDANWLTANGLPTVTLGCGQQDSHTVKESLEIKNYLNACRIALLLATGA